MALCFLHLPIWSAQDSTHCKKQCLSCFAIGEVGVSKKNNIKRVMQYLQSVNIKSYANYCAAFVVFCQDAVNIKPVRRSAVARHHITNKSIPAYRVLMGFVEIPKDALVIWGYNNDWRGHIAITTKKWKGKLGYTVEGNTSKNSTREGGNVEIKNRVINRHSSFRITHFTVLEYKNEYTEIVYSFRLFAFNLGILPTWLHNETN